MTGTTDKAQHLFAIVPIDAARDHRLTAAQYRVLIGLLTFRAKNTDTVWPSRAALAERTGYTITTISKYTRQLESLGWLTKDGAGGRGKSTCYRITVPDLDGYETVSTPDTVSEEKTVSNPDTVSPVNGSQPGNGSRVGNGSLPGHPNSSLPGHRFGLNGSRVGHPEQTIKTKQTKEQTKSNTRARNTITLEGLPKEIDTETAKEFIAHRKQLKKPLTQGAFDRAMKEAIKAANLIGISPNQAITETIDAGWQGIRAEWLLNRLGKTQRPAHHGIKTIDETHSEASAQAERVRQLIGGN